MTATRRALVGTSLVGTSLVGTSLVGTSLLLAAPAPAVSLDVLTAAGSAADPAAPLVAVVTLAAWTGAGYLLLVTLLTLGSRLPGLTGRLLRATLRLAAPVALRRSVEVALGVGLAVGTVTATPALALERPAVSFELPGSSAAPDLDWPVTEPGRPATRTVDAAPPAPEPRAAGGTRPAPPTAGAPAVRPAATRRPAPTAAATVTVRPGDSLWSLVAGDLGPRATDRAVAAAWPSWWQANREVVGDDPDLLLPGTTLVRPSPDHS